MKTITSVQNPVVKAARALAQAQERARAGAFLLDGEHMVQEALRVCPDRVRCLFVQEARAQRYAGLLKDAKADVYAVPEHVMEALTQVRAPQGVAAVCAQPPAAAPEAMEGRLVLLENVQDPGNVGTIVRTLDAAGFDGLLLTPGCADPFGPKALRASMGSALRVPVGRTPDAAEAVKALNARGYATLAATLDGTPFYDRPPLPDRLCLLVGNEGAGLQNATAQACRYRFRLPMRGGVESLNAAAAAAVFLYDLMNR